MQEKMLEEYRGQKIAIDATVVLCEFLATKLGKLKSKNDKPTGHLLGFLTRTVKFLSLQIDPIYIFDGDTPEIKQPELQRRRAKKYGNAEVAPYLGVNSQEFRDRYEECRILMLLMGIPCFKALDEGESQCCHLCKKDQVNAVASQDADCLAYGGKKVIMNFKASEDEAIEEYDHKIMLDELGLSKESFIDFCILAGCDYCDRIEGMDGENALELIRQFTTIEDVLKNIDRNKYQIPEKWMTQYHDARRQFTEPKVKNIADDELKTKQIDEEGLKRYLVTVHDFQMETVEKILSRTEPDTVSSKKGSSTRRRTKPRAKSSMLITQFFSSASKRSSEKGTGEGESSKRSKP